MRIFVIILIIIYFCPFLYSDYNIDTISMGAGARPLSMGEAYSSIGEDLYSLYYNPSGITYLDRGEFGIHFSRYYQDINYGTISLVLPFKDNFHCGLSYYKLNYGDISIVENTVDGYSINGKTSPSDQIFILSIGKMIYYDIAVGMNIKIINQNIYNYNQSEYLLDIGIIRKFFKSRLSIGTVLKNINIINNDNFIPVDINIGASYYILKNYLSHHSLLASIDMKNILLNVDKEYNFGIEYSIYNKIYLRGGYKIGCDLGNLTHGAGVKWPFFLFELRLDYVFINFSDLGLTHNFSLSGSFDFGPKPSKIRTQKKLFKFHYNQGNLYLGEEKYDLALEQYLKAKNLYPEDKKVIHKIIYIEMKQEINSIINRIQNLIKEKNINDASDLYIEILNKYPNDESILELNSILEKEIKFLNLINRAKYYLKIGEKELAEIEIKEALKIYPKSNDALQLLESMRK